METKNSVTVPAAIIISGVIIAVAIVYGIGKLATPKANPPAEGRASISADLEKMRPVSAADHIRGNTDKTVVEIIEYSDTECPFCKRFHRTMRDVVKAYDGKVAWVYRHFPLEQLHSRAKNEAKATECAAKIGGPAMFWSYVDALFEITPSNDQLDPAELPRIAGKLGIDRAKFADCLANPDTTIDKKIADDIENALATGGNGTPWSILIDSEGKKYPINGAQPFETIKQLIDLVLKTK